MFDITKTRLILRAYMLSQVDPLPQLQQWENRPFEIPDAITGNWIREIMEYSGETVIASNTKSHKGNYRIDVVVPTGSGTEYLDSVTNAIVSAFPPGTALTDSPETCVVNVRASQRLQARRDTTSGAWYSQPVMVSWEVYSYF